MSASKERIDKLMVQRQLVASRERAQSLIMAGKILVDCLEEIDRMIIFIEDLKNWIDKTTGVLEESC